MDKFEELKKLLGFRSDVTPHDICNYLQNRFVDNTPYVIKARLSNGDVLTLCEMWVSKITQFYYALCYEIFSNKIDLFYFLNLPEDVGQIKVIWLECDDWEIKESYHRKRETFFSPNKNYIGFTYPSPTIFYLTDDSYCGYLFYDLNKNYFSLYGFDGEV